MQFLAEFLAYTAKDTHFLESEKTMQAHGIQVCGGVKAPTRLKEQCPPSPTRQSTGVRRRSTKPRRNTTVTRRRGLPIISGIDARAASAIHGVG